MRWRRIGWPSTWSLTSPAASTCEESDRGTPVSAGVLMLGLNNRGRPLSVGSLFSYYGGLDLAVEHAHDAETV